MRIVPRVARPVSRFFQVLLAAAVLPVGASEVTPAHAATAPAPVLVRVRLHTRLLRSLPKADSTVTRSPDMVELWFSERIDLGLSRITLLDSRRQPIALSAPTRDDTKPTAPVVARLTAPLPDGVYAVQWTAASKDGHPVKGMFSFTVKRS